MSEKNQTSDQDDLLAGRLGVQPLTDQVDSSYAVPEYEVKPAAQGPNTSLLVTLLIPVLIVVAVVAFVQFSNASAKSALQDLAAATVDGYLVDVAAGNVATANAALCAPTPQLLDFGTALAAAAAARSAKSPRDVFAVTDSAVLATSVPTATKSMIRKKPVVNEFDLIVAPDYDQWVGLSGDLLAAGGPQQVKTQLPSQVTFHVAIKGAQGCIAYIRPNATDAAQMRQAGDSVAFNKANPVPTTTPGARP